MHFLLFNIVIKFSQEFSLKSESIGKKIPKLEKMTRSARKSWVDRISRNTGTFLGLSYLFLVPVSKMAHPGAPVCSLNTVN